MIILSSNNTQLDKPNCKLINYHIHFLSTSTDTKDLKNALSTAKSAMIGKIMLMNINAITFFNYRGLREDVRDYKVVGYIGLPTVCRLYAYYVNEGASMPAVQKVLLRIQELHNGTQAEIVTSPEKWIYDNFSTQMITNDEMKEFDQAVKQMWNEATSKRSG